MNAMNRLLVVIALCFTVQSRAAVTSVYESTTVKFEAGSTSLNASETAKLREAIQNAKAKGEVAKIEVAAWSDKDYPRGGKNLSKDDRKLADERISSIKGEIRDETSMFERIKAFNMAKGSHWLGRTLNTSGSKLDAVFAKKDTDALVREDFNLIKDEGAPSKAVVIFKIKDKE